MNNDIHIKIYRDGHYSYSDNLKMKLRAELRKTVPILIKIDDYFVNH